jgi:hypothetical protein
MFYWKLFKNKYFWLIIVLISISVGVFSYHRDRKMQKLLDTAPPNFCYEYRDSVKVSSILVITDFDYAEEYVAYFSGEREKQNFRSISVPEGTVVMIIGEKYDGKLLKAIHIDKSGKRTKYEEFWIWYEFVYGDKSLTQ